jgi:hypothetical protein
MKHTGTWCRKDGGYQVHVPGWRLNLTIWFSHREQLLDFAIANDIKLKEVKWGGGKGRTFPADKETGRKAVWNTHSHAGQAVPEEPRLPAGKDRQERHDPPGKGR